MIKFLFTLVFFSTQTSFAEEPTKIKVDFECPKHTKLKLDQSSNSWSNEIKTEAYCFYQVEQMIEIIDANPRKEGTGRFDTFKDGPYAVYTNGSKTESGTYKKNKRVGMMHYYKNGTMFAENPFNDEGQQHGTQKTWCMLGGTQKTNKPCVIANYKNGKLHGKKQRFSIANGKVSEEINYHEGNQHGVHKKWTYNGKLLFEHHYKNGGFEGVQRTWLPDGSMSSLEVYKEGQQVYSFQGKDAISKAFADGKINKKWK